MNNNKQDEAAILGVFSKSSYISFGTVEKPEEYVKKGLERSNFLGKQFVSVPAKEGKTPDTFFEKKHLWIGDGDKYADRVMYKDLQPGEKKKGFYTSDFSKRDEFSNTIRTGQYREQLKKEMVFTKRALEVQGDTPEFIEAMAAQSPKKEVLLYDAVFEKDDPHTTGSSKVHRDTKNKTLLSPERDFGGQMTVNQLTYQAPKEYTKPEFGRTGLVKETFFRPTFGGFGNGESS